MGSQLEFIGRTAEITRIMSAVQEWGTNRAVVIEGKGGVGKTRLLDEVRARVFDSRSAAILRQPVTISLVQEFTDSEWSREFLRGCRQMAVELGVNLRETDAHFDLRRMADDLRHMAAEKPDALIISLGNGELVAEAATDVARLGIPVLTFDNYLQGVEGLVSRVVQDQLEGAHRLAAQMAEDMNYRGAVTVLYSDAAGPLTQRYERLLEVLRQYPEIKVHAKTVPVTQDAEKAAYDQVSALLSEPAFESAALWVAFNELARGAVRALVAANRTDIKVYNFDYCPSDPTWMGASDSPWMAAVATDPFEDGCAILRLATLAAHGRELKYRYTLPMDLLRSDDLGCPGPRPGVRAILQLGWTPWLKAVQMAHQTSDADYLEPLDVLDFDERGLQVEDSLEIRLAHNIRNSPIAPFLNELHALRVMEESGVHREALERQQIVALDTLAASYNALAAKRRVVLFFDTVEKLSETSRARLVNFLERLQNVVCVFAGRPEPQTANLRDLLSARSAIDTDVLTLNPFDRETSRLYLAKKLERLHTPLPSRLKDIIVTFAGGRPILIDLAARWTQSFSLTELTQNFNVAEFERLTADQQAAEVERFQKRLVEYFLPGHDLDSHLLLIMSRIYPISESMVQVVLNIGVDECGELFSRASSDVFVKTRPDGLSLHDEVRYLFERYVWPHKDPTGQRMRHYSGLAASLYRQQDVELRERRKRLGDDAPARSDVETQIMRERLRVARENATEKWLEHALQANPSAGFADWRGVVERVRAGRKYRFIIRLVEMLPEDIHDQLGVGDQFWCDFMVARARADIGERKEAEPKLLELLGQVADAPERKALMLNVLGVLETRDGRFEKALDYQRECLKLMPPRNQSARAKLLNQIGYNYRLLDEVDAAESSYIEALNLATKLDAELDADLERQKTNRELIAGLYNNLAYVYGIKLNKNYQLADDYCSTAEQIYLALGRRREVGRVMMTRGILARDRAQYTQSRSLLAGALIRLQDPDDFQEICRAHFHLGWTLWFMSEPDDSSDPIDIDLLTQAESSLIKSQVYADKYQLRQELPGILHQLASVTWRLGRSQQQPQRCTLARQINERAYQVSQEINNMRYAVDSLVGFAEFDADEGIDTSLQKYEEELKPYEARDNGHVYRLYYGRMRRLIGDAAFKAGDHRLAFTKYAEGLVMINAHGGYGPFSIKHELKALASNLETLPPAVAMECLGLLRESWSRTLPSAGRQVENLGLWLENQELAARLRRIG